jgi:hypothetical protein
MGIQSEKKNLNGEDLKDPKIQEIFNLINTIEKNSKESMIKLNENTFGSKYGKKILKLENNNFPINLKESIVNLKENINVITFFNYIIFNGITFSIFQFDKNKKKRSCYLNFTEEDKEEKFGTIINIININYKNLKIDKIYLFIELFEKFGYLMDSDIPILIENKIENKKYLLLDIDNLGEFVIFGLIKLKIKNGLKISKEKSFENILKEDENEDKNKDKNENILCNIEFSVVIM